jgi:dTMP kinase
MRTLWKHSSSERAWEPLAEAFLLFAARRMLWCREIQPHLTQGTWVLCDRFYDSTLVYQGVLGGADIEKLMKMKTLALEENEPDITLLFDLSPNTAMKRIAQRNPNCQNIADYYDSMSIKKHEKIRQAYLRLAKIFTFRIRIIKARASEAVVQQSVRQVLDDLLSRVKRPT